MAKWRICKIIDDDTLEMYTSVDYDAAVKDESSAIRSWMHSAPLCMHLQIQDADDPDEVSPIKKAATILYEGVNFTADDVGEVGNGIILDFDGSDDITTVVDIHNAAYPSQTISHDGTGTDVLDAGSATLADGGWALEVSQAVIDANLQAVRDAKLALMRSDRDKMASESDREIAKHDDSDTNKIDTLANWQTYRIALRDVTNDYRTNSDPTHADFTKGTSDFDSLEDDLSDYTWPTKPS